MRSTCSTSARRYVRGAPALFATPSAGNSASQDRSTYGCTLARSQTSAALKSARRGISISTSGMGKKSISDAGVAKSTTRAGRDGKVAHFVPGDARHRRDDELRDSHATGHAKWLPSQVDDRHADLATVVRVDRRRRVRQADAVPHCKPGPGPHLPLESL